MTSEMNILLGYKKGVVSCDFSNTINEMVNSTKIKINIVRVKRKQFVFEISRLGSEFIIVYNRNFIRKR